MKDNIAKDVKGLDFSVIKLDEDFYLQIEDDLYEISLVFHKNIFLLKNNKKTDFIDFISSISKNY